jgi:ABC-type Na+ efflux pump permease subunit
LENIVKGIFSGFTVLYCWLDMLFSDEQKTFSPEAAPAILILSFLFTLFSSVLGVFISMCSSSVRQAQQVTGLIGLIPILPIILVDVLPDETVRNLMANMSQVNGRVMV